MGVPLRDQELKIIREIIQRDSINRTQISREVCRALNWLKPDGKLKEMSCRVALLRMHRSGILELPPPQHGDPNRSRHRHLELTTASDPGKPHHGPAIRARNGSTGSCVATESIVFME